MVKKNMGNTLMTLASNQRWFAILVIFIVTLIVAGIISITWGVMGLVGLFLVFASLYIIFLQRGNVAMSFHNPATIFFIIGIVLLILNFAGVDKAYIVDLSAIPGLSELKQIFNP